MYRVLPFDRVKENLRRGKYRGKIMSADYANTGIQTFDYRKFAGQLGTNYHLLKEMGLIKITEQAGWNLPTEPTVDELENFRDVLCLSLK